MKETFTLLIRTVVVHKDAGLVCTDPREAVSKWSSSVAAAAVLEKH